jgi:cytochrome c556
MRAALASAVTIFLASLALSAQSGASQQQQQQPAQQKPAEQKPAEQKPAEQKPAEQPAAPAAPAPPPGTPTKALVPVAASTLGVNPDPYYGEFVSLTGTVEQTLSKLAFSVDQDAAKSTGKEVLVLTRHMNASVDPKSYVTVIGQLVKFDPAEVGAKFKEFAADLPSDVAQKYLGRPVVIASSVISAAGLDVTRRLPPPMTADEEALSKIMKQVGPANGALRKAIEASDAKLATENAAILRQAFTQTESFWKDRKRHDATAWAADAKKLAESIHRSAAAGKWDEVKTSATTLGQACQTCHTTYRERYDDGSFRIKKPSTSTH